MDEKFERRNFEKNKNSSDICLMDARGEGLLPILCKINSRAYYETRFYTSSSGQQKFSACDQAVCNLTVGEVIAKHLDDAVSIGVELSELSNKLFKKNCI